MLGVGLQGGVVVMSSKWKLGRRVEEAVAAIFRYNVIRLSQDKLKKAGIDKIQ